MDPVRGALTCNLGDSLQYWTEDALRATLHRVRVPLAGEYQGERFSVAYFANSRYSTVIQGEGARYPPVTFRQILDNKKAIAPKVNPDGRIDPAALLRFQQAGAFGPELSEDGRGAHPLRAGAAGA